MSTITTIQSTDAISASRSTINTNFANLNTDKAELSGATFTGDISVPDEAYGVGWNGSMEVPTKNAIYDKIETMGGGGATTFLGLTDTPSSYSGQAGKFTKVNAGETALEFVTITGGGDLLSTNNLSDVANVATARSNLGLNTTANQTDSTDKRFMTDAQEAKLDAISGTNTGDETTSRINTLYGTTNAFTAGSIELGHATDTTISRVSAGRIAVEGVNVPTTSSTDTITNKTIALGSNTISGTVAQFNTAITDGDMATLTGTETLTNKRIQKRVVTTTQSATPTINTNNGDIFQITGLAQAITSFTTNLSGTPVNGEMICIQITDNGTARAITWGASFEASTVALPTTTVISTRLDVLFTWNSATSKWRCIASA